MFSRLPPVTQALLIANTALFLLQLMLGQSTFAPFMLWPLGGFTMIVAGSALWAACAARRLARRTSASSLTRTWT